MWPSTWDSKQPEAAKAEQEESLLYEGSFRKSLSTKRQVIRYSLFPLAGLTLGFTVGVILQHFLSLRWNPTISPTACTQPAMRREWRSLSTNERHNYIEAVQCLTTLPSKVRDNGTLYDDFPWIHRYYGGFSHDSAAFLSWHRYYIHLYEKTLREDCGYQGRLTYWDWSLDWEDLTKSPVWDSDQGFGGDGDPNGEETVGHGRCVVDGPFRSLRLLFYDDSDQPHCLSRGFFDGNEDGKLPGEGVSPESVDKILDKTNFRSFYTSVDAGPHNAIANHVRGEFLQFYAPGDPLFFLHHTQLDRLWWLWQRRNPLQRQKEYLGRANRDTTVQASLSDKLPMGGFAADIQVDRIMDTTDGFLCYTY